MNTEQISAVFDQITARKAQAAAVTKPRFAGIDIIKILACFLVVAVHFFRNAEFYTMQIRPGLSILAIYGRWIAFNCVPLFMITTGFLMKNKKLSGKYYLGILRVLCIYIVISLICVIFNKHYYHLTYTSWQVVRGLFMYTDAQYAWYVEYYFTIFLLIPFLNAGYQAMETRGRKTALLATVILLTMVSQTFYIGTVRAEQIRIFPGYFSRCYPIGYYFIGTYIREFPPKRDLKHKMVYIILFLFSLIYVSTMTLYQCLKNEEKSFTWLSWHNDDYAAWPTVVMSTMIFLLLFDITVKKPRTAKILSVLSNATFAAYLISYVFDCIAYRHLNESVGIIAKRFRFAPLVVPGVFICAMLSGMLIEWLYERAEARFKRDYTEIKKRRNRRKQPSETT